MNTARLYSIRLPTLARLAFCTLLVFAMGCGSSSLEVTARNNSGQRLENVTVSGGGKRVRFGVLPDRGIKGYMTAESIFGRTIPSSMVMNFENLDGESFQREVTFENKPTRILAITIDKDWNVHGTYE